MMATEFISRKYGTEGYEVIIKTDNEKHYEAAVGFARQLIGHAKPMTNADRIRTMTDEELAMFFTKRETDRAVRQKVAVEGYALTATLISSLTRSAFAAWVHWLRAPAEDRTWETTM